MKKAPFQCFQVTRRHEGKGYEMLYIKISTGDKYEYQYGFRHERWVELRWQANTDDNEQWYAGRITVKGTDPEVFACIGKMAKALNFDSHTQPQAVVEYLLSKGFMQVEHHSLPLGYQPVNAWPAGSVWSIRNAKNEGVAHVTALAEYQAQQAAKAWMLKQSEHSPYWETELIGWLMAGKPVVEVVLPQPLPELPELTRTRSALEEEDVA